MTYSYSQISQYVACPRRYRYRYLEGWKEKATNANLLFGRAFEAALSAYFEHKDSGAVFFEEWSRFREVKVEYRKGDTWDSMLHEGIHLLERFCQDNRIRIQNAKLDLQRRIERPLSAANNFVAYVDAVAELDGRGPCIVDWKTTTSRYAEKVSGMLVLDPQLAAYSWASGIADVAMVFFVRKRACEVQYLRTTISKQRRQEFAEMLESAIEQIEAARFPSHTGIRFPQNGCASCRYLGLCLNRADLVDSALTRQEGAKRDWIDQLDY